MVDVGTSDSDASAGAADAATQGPDGGSVPPDAAMADPEDAATAPEPDAEVGLDAEAVSSGDAQAAAPDSSGAAPDAGVPPDASATQPPDAGQPPDAAVPPDGSTPQLTDRSTTGVQMVDLDGDTDLDIVWVSQPPKTGMGEPGGLDLTINLGNGQFAAGDVSVLSALGEWTFVLPVDVDGDGDPDLVLTRPATTRAAVAVLRNDGTGKFSHDPADVPTINGTVNGYTFGRAAAGDFDGDGDADLIIPIAFSVPPGAACG